MEEIFTDFGVEPVLIAAQIVNFLILLLILKRFLYRPLLRVIEDRRKVVSDSLTNAKTIEKRLQQIDNESAQKLSAVSKEAQKIIDDASNVADEIITQAHQKAREDIDLMVKKAKQNLLKERNKVEQEIHKEFVKLVVFGIEKTTGKVLQQTDHKRIIEQQLNNLKKQ